MCGTVYYQRMRILPAAAVLCAVFVANARAVKQSLSAVEQQLAAHADGSRAEAEKLLERAVNINSGTMNFAGVKRVGELFDAEFKALGFKTTWRDGASFKRAGHLIAERDGKGPRILLIGHLDTVFEAESPFQ